MLECLLVEGEMEGRICNRLFDRSVSDSFNHSFRCRAIDTTFLKAEFLRFPLCVGQLPFPIRPTKFDLMANVSAQHNVIIRVTVLHSTRMSKESSSQVPVIHLYRGQEVEDRDQVTLVLLKYLVHRSVKPIERPTISDGPVEERFLRESWVL